jgi:hypothetical protein
MRIIALRGRGYIGKTTTINLLANRLPNFGWINISREIHGNGIDVIGVYVSTDGKRLGIASAGDHYDEVEPALQKLKAAECSIVVCACRTKDMPNADGIYRGTNTALNEFSDDISFVNKTIIDLEDKNVRHQANQDDVQQLLNRL